MSHTRYEACRRVIARGLLGLAAGSALLLVCKLSGVPALWGDLSAFAGGCAVLYGNGCIIYGLLIFADARGDG